jgi:hypothetical protein
MSEPKRKLTAALRHVPSKHQRAWTRFFTDALQALGRQPSARDVGVAIQFADACVYIAKASGKRPVGRPPIGEKAMSDAARARRYRKRKRVTKTNTNGATNAFL